MRHQNIGSSGLFVSELRYGTATFGDRCRLPGKNAGPAKRIEHVRDNLNTAGAFA